MNSDEVTLPLSEATEDAPSTAPLLKELLTDVRELKSSVATLIEVVQRLEQRFDDHERQQRLTRIELDKIGPTQTRHDIRLTVLEQDVTTLRHHALESRAAD